jgi:hypothetical protein
MAREFSELQFIELIGNKNTGLNVRYFCRLMLSQILSKIPYKISTILLIFLFCILTFHLRGYQIARRNRLYKRKLTTFLSQCQHLLVGSNS